MKIFVINGPNLNLLGQRQNDIYGKLTLSDIEQQLKEKADELDVEVVVHQSNSEGDLVDIIHQAGVEAEGIVVNPAAYTHYSIAIRDALSAVDIPAVEVHISSIFSREKFRRESVTAPACMGGVWGFGPDVYQWGLQALVRKLRSEKE